MKDGEAWDVAGITSGIGCVLIRMWVGEEKTEEKGSSSLCTPVNDDCSRF